MLNALSVNNYEINLGICLAVTVEYASAECELAVVFLADNEFVVEVRALASDIVTFANACINVTVVIPSVLVSVLKLALVSPICIFGACKFDLLNNCVCTASNTDLDSNYLTDVIGEVIRAVLCFVCVNVEVILGLTCTADNLAVNLNYEVRICFAVAMEYACAECKNVICRRNASVFKLKS